MTFEIFTPFSILGGQHYNVLQEVIIIKINRKIIKFFRYSLIVI